MHGEYKMPGGKLIVIDLHVQEGRLVDVQLSGDFFLEPDDMLHVINAALEGQRADLTEQATAKIINAALPPHILMYGISPEAIATAVNRALHKEPEA